VDNEPDLLRRLRESPVTTRERLWAGAAEPFVRALANVRVVRRGPGVRLEMSAELTAEERKLVRESLEESDPDDQAMVAVLDSLSADAPPPVDALSRFLGDEVAAWAAAPRATEADCKLLLGKYEALAADPSALEQVDLRDRWGRAFEPDVCKGMVLPDNFRSCLMGASSLAKLAQCPPPRSPYVAEAHRRLEGQWSVVDVEGDQLSYFARMSLSGGARDRSPSDRDAEPRGCGDLPTVVQRASSEARHVRKDRGHLGHAGLRARGSADISSGQLLPVAVRSVGPASS
jgi:hypothetical protein